MHTSYNYIISTHKISDVPLYIYIYMCVCIYEDYDYVI